MESEALSEQKSVSDRADDILRQVQAEVAADDEAAGIEHDEVSQSARSEVPKLSEPGPSENAEEENDGDSEDDD